MHIHAISTIWYKYNLDLYKIVRSMERNEVVFSMEAQNHNILRIPATMILITMFDILVSLYINWFSKWVYIFHENVLFYYNLAVLLIMKCYWFAAHHNSLTWTCLVPLDETNVGCPIKLNINYIIENASN